MKRLFLDAARRFERYRNLPLGTLVKKGVTHALGVATAPVYLRGVDVVGSGVRTVGAPFIENSGRIEIGDGVTIRSRPVPVELAAGVGARLVIGANTFINYGASLGATGSIEIGARVNIGPYVMIIDTQFHDAYDRDLVPEPQPVVIEDDVFLGAKSSVMPGVRVGRGAIVGTNAVVTKDVEPFTVVAGIPARVVKRLDPEKFVVRR